MPRKKKTDGAITVIIKEPNKAPKVCEIENTLEELQKIVGGYIEVIGYSSTIVLVVNDDRINAPIPPNLAIGSTVLYGTVIVSGVRGTEFASVPEREVKPMAELLRGWDING